MILKKMSLLATSLILNVSFCFSQNFSSTDPAYIENVQLGEAALKGEKYDSCISYYKEAFLIKQTSVLSTLRFVACAFSSNEKEVYNAQLSKAMELGSDEAKQLFHSYPEFAYLKESQMDSDIESRWIVEAKKAGLDVDLIKEFDNILQTDQAQRREMGPISDQYGWKSPQMDSLWKIQNYHDSVNTVTIVEILEKDGYPGKSRVGSGHQGTAFLVIQHAEHDIQVKYLPLISAAADAGEVKWSSVALLVDRVRQGEGKKQIYGSQVSRDPETNEYYFGEIEEPFKVDSIRASVGLGLLDDYAKNWEFNYDPEKHVKRYSKKE